MVESDHKITELRLNNDYEGEVKATLLVAYSENSSFASAVLYIHGYLDYYFQYHMAEFFTQSGQDFYALDLRKYGRSYMPHQHFNYCRDLHEYYPEIDAALDAILGGGATDITLMGHSTGGLLAALYSSDGGRREFINRLILNSPFLEFNMGWPMRNIVIPVASAISRLFPYAATGNQLSENYFKSIHKSENGEWDFDTSLKPEVSPRLYLAWVRAIRNGHKKIKKGLGLPIPVLVICSGKSDYHKKWHRDAAESDTILNVEHIKEYGRMLGNNVRIEQLQGALHDVVLSAPDVRQRAFTIMEYFISRGAS